MYIYLSSAKMFCAGLLQRRLSQRLPQSFGFNPKKSFSDEKKAPNVFLWGGGLGKLQGGLKEEEYFISLTQSLVNKMQSKKDEVDNMPNWDEFQKTLDHSSIANTSCMNKHKNVLEEAFFLNETADNLKILHDRAQDEAQQRVMNNAATDVMEHLKPDSHTIK
ncbi:hypothetical protein KR026_011643 [Drosophila bipectinata]|nr:hypothetical protein KR026_011643 [Drosophila bipectinata]